MYIDGVAYTDGGVIPPGCSAAAPADKIPLKPIADAEVDAFLIAYLNPDNQVDKSLIRGAKPCLELRPSTPLEERPGLGTMDFSPDRLISHERLGYADTVKLVKDLL